MALRGISIPSRFMVSLKAIRSSPRSMASTSTPMTFTPYSSRTPGLGQFRGEVQPGLAAQVGQEGIGPFFLDDLVHGLEIQGFDIGHIGHSRIGHDGGRIGVDQDDFITELSQGLAGLGAGIVEFTGLADDDRAGTDNHHLVDILTFGHGTASWKGRVIIRTEIAGTWGGI